METLRDFMHTKKFYACIFTASLLIMFQRNPAVLRYANFWSEDGNIFYAQLHNDGIISFLYPYAGYLHLAPRLAMLITLPFGIINAPFIVNFLGLVLRAMPVFLLFSERFSFVGLAYKFFFWAYYLLVPNIGETLGNTVNVQWHLALWLLMVLAANIPSSSAWKIHDWFVLILSGLSGPFVIFLAPFMLRKLRNGGGGIFKTALLAFSAIQLLVVVMTAEEIRQAASISPDFVLQAIKVFDARILWGTFLPSYIFHYTLANALMKSTIISLLPFIAVMSLLAYHFVHGSHNFRMSAIFGAAVFMSALYRMRKGIDDGSIIAGSAERYFLIPDILAFAFVLYLMKHFIGTRPEVRMKAYIVVSAVLFLIAGTSFTLPAWYGNPGYRESIMTLYYPAPKGSIVEIPIAPKGGVMILTKKE